MSICWYCYWGWPKQIREIYDNHIDAAGELAMHFGPAHIVWEDENFERHHIQWCLDHFADAATNTQHSAEELDAVRQSLVDMLRLPDSILNAMPSDYDGEHPDKYPPPSTIDMDRR